MTFREGLKEQLKDPEFKAEYEAMEPEASTIGISSDGELWNHIELSLSHAKQHVGRNADSVVKDLKKEFAV